MKRFTALVLTCLLLGLPLAAFAEDVFAVQPHFPQAQNVSIRDAVALPDGGLLISGDCMTMVGEKMATTGWAMRLTPDLTMQWKYTVGEPNPANYNGLFRGRMMSSDLFVFEHQSHRQGDEDYIYNALMLDGDGNLVREFPLGPWVMVEAADEDGILARDGAYRVLSNGESWFVPSFTRYDREGNPQWTISPEELAGAGFFTAQTEEAYFLAGGQSTTHDQQGRVEMAAKINLDGTVAWVKTLPEEGSSGFMAAMPTDDGGMIAVGARSYYEAENRLARAVRFDADGGVVWDKTYPLPGQLTFSDIVAAEDGYLLMTEGRPEETLLYKMDDNGELTGKITLTDIPNLNVHTKLVKTGTDVFLYGMRRQEPSEGVFTFDSFVVRVTE